MHQRIMMLPPLRNFVLPFLLAVTASAQTAGVPWKKPAPWSGPSALPTPAAQAPRETKLVEKKMEQLTSKTPSDDGQKALAIDPAKWKHAETDNFILHYRRATEAQKVAREVEYDLWFVQRRSARPGSSPAANRTSMFSRTTRSGSNSSPCRAIR